MTIALGSLPTELLASSLSYLDYRHAVRMALVSRRFRASIVPDGGADGATAPSAQDFWRSLCKSTFRMDDARFREWPGVACWMDMYRILNEWGRREGFYMLEQAWPWGLLCLFHLEGGKFVGEVLTPRSFSGHSRRLREGGDYRSDGLFDREVFFEAAFGEGGLLEDGAVCGGDRTCALFSEESLGEDPLRIISMAGEVHGQGYPINILSRSSREENIVFLEGELSPAEPQPGTSRRSWPLRQLQRIRDRLSNRRRLDTSNSTWEPFVSILPPLLRDEEMLNDSWTDRLDELDANGEIGPASVEDARRIFQLWRAQHRNIESIMGAEFIRSMWNLFDADHFQHPGASVPKMLNFQYIDGPSHELREGICMDGMPIIHPGLYCGTYHPELYGKYCNEILLVEYRRYTDAHEEQTWVRIHAEIFNSQDADGMIDHLRARIDETGEREIVFVVGRKVTGDMHVPAGKCSFGALVHPLLPDPNPDSPEIKYVASSEDREELLNVVRRWHGFGTMAFPIFNSPSTHSGTLVQLENDKEGNHRFGFLWERSSNETIVLKWLPIQDRYPWFHK